MAEKKKSISSSVEEEFINAFDQHISSQSRLNIFFAAAVFLELITLIVLIPFFVQSASLAFMVATLLLTIFGYLMLRQYLGSQKLAYFETLLRDLLARLQPNQEIEAENRIEVARVCARIADRLHHREYSYYPLPRKLKFLTPWSEVLSGWLHWQDLHAMRELLLQTAVNQYLEIVRREPTNPDAHALLANAYVLLSGLYLDPRKLSLEENECWIPKEMSGVAMQARFKACAQKAVEEFKILKEYAPNDPWIYSQLAYSYRDLHMPHEEKASYEAILALRPNDHETRFKLGTLYFQHGDNARGLKIYEELKNANYNKAHELLSIYGMES